MIDDLIPVPLEVARHCIAKHLLAARPEGDAAIGRVRLWPHQRDAVARVREAIAEFGGALLADDVGAGKTFVALAIAARYSAPLVVGPAALRARWRAAAEDAGCAPLPFVSFESLSRRHAPHAARDAAHDFIIADEAHHCRNPLTRRYAALAALAHGVPILLLSATPIHNRRADIVALLALFLGASAAGLDGASLARCVIRRGRGALGSTAPLPSLRGPVPLHCHADGRATPDAILALPPPVPPADAGTAGALLTFTMLRQWASSQGALLAGVRRRLAVAHALASTLDDGRYPSRAELAAWTLGDDAQQLALGSLLATGDGPAPRAELQEAVAAHAEGLRAIRRAAAGEPDADRRRAECLRECWAAHPGARSIAFSQFAETVDAYWRELRRVPGVCALTSHGARTAGGKVSRSDALGSLRPGRAGPAANRIVALLTTDLASEGIDLQDASVLVHLDLPWTPARLEQRVGRLVRPGSPHAVVHVYRMEPPIAATTLLDIGRRLAEKLVAARLTLGHVMTGLGVDGYADAGALPSFGNASAPTSAAEELEALLTRWRNGGRTATSPDAIAQSVVAAAHASRPGWLALVDGTPPRLVASDGGRVGDDPTLAAAVAAVIDVLPNGAPDRTTLRSGAISAARERLAHWMAAKRGAGLAGVEDLATVHRRRGTLAAVAGLANSPASARAHLARVAQRALAAAGHRMGAGAERALAALSKEARADDPAWLDAVAAIAPSSRGLRTAPPAERIVALIVLDAEG